MMARILLLLAFTSSVAANDMTTVKLDNFSGVVISPSGLIATADHCGDARTVTVQFSNGATRIAALRYGPPRNGIDEAQIYQITGGGEFAFSPIATSVPSVGDSVTSAGYPDGNLVRKEGRITQTGFTVRPDGQYALNLTDGLVTDWNSESGASGSPLFNNKGEVVGILSMSGNWPLSYWIGLDSIVDSVRRSQFPTHKQRLVMFSVPGDKDCELYEKEIKATRNGIHVVRTDSPEFPQWKTAYEASVGKPLNQFPAFWVEGTNYARASKYEPGFLGSLLSWFRNIIHALISGLFGSPDSAPAAPQQYVRTEPPAPVEIKTPEEELLDPSNITVVILAKKQDIGIAKGVAAKIALGKVAGPLQRKLDEVLGGKARLVLIPERTLPERFAAVASAAKTEADPAAVFVLVRAQSLGLKTLIAGKVERTILGKIPPSVPVEIVFERVNSDDFHAILEATYAGETPDPEVITLPGEPAEVPVSNGILAGGLASIAGAWGAKEAIAKLRKRAAGKALEIVKSKIGSKEEEV